MYSNELKMRSENYCTQSAIKTVGTYFSALILSFLLEIILAQTLAAQIGFGNAAGFLYNKGMMGPPPTRKSASGADNDGFGVNPITGMIQGELPPEPEMTEEEKEQEAEKLFVLFERLERAGGGENPIRRALHEGKLEKYQAKIEEVESDSE